MSKRKILIVISILLIALLAIFGISKMIRHFQKEACIKKGGTWNSELNKCETASIDSIALQLEYYWHIAYDSLNNREYLEKGRMLDSITPTVENLIEILNKRRPECKIEYVDLRKDTLHVRILKDEILTEQMGSTGAFCFLGETVYTLTENDSIRYVMIDMEEGSHARPGIYVRDGFKELEKK